MAESQKPTKRQKPERAASKKSERAARQKRAETKDAPTKASSAKTTQVDTRKSTRPRARKEPAKPAQKFEFSPQGIRAWAGAHKPFVITLAIIVFVIFAIYPPLCSLYSAARTNAVLSEKLADVNEQVEALTNDVSKLTSEDGLKDEARRLGYVEEGETAVDMEGIEDSGSVRSDTTVMEESKETETEDPWYITVGDFIFRYDAETQGIK